MAAMTGEHRFLSRRRAVAYLLTWLVLALWLAAPAWNFSHQIKGTLTGVRDTDSEQVRKTLVENFSSSLAFPTAVIWDAEGLSPEEGQARWQEIMGALRSAPGVSEASDAKRFLETWPRESWHAAFVELKATSYAEAEKQIPGLRQHLREQVKLPPDRVPHVTGGPALFMDLNLASTEALRAAEMKALPVAFIILLIVFRSFVAALLPVIVAGLGVLISLGAMSILAAYWPVTFFVPNLITMIGLGVGIDYSLIFLARYRRERELHLTTQEALHVTAKTAGHTVVTSAVMVMSGFVALLIIPLQFFHSIAVAGMLVVGCVAASTLTLLPAFIFLLGHRLEWGQIISHHGTFSEKARHFYHWWARVVLAYPWRCFALGTIILLVVAYPLTRLQVTSIQVNTLPAKAEARMGYDSLSKEMGAGWLMPTIILAQHPTADWMTSGEGLKREVELVAKLRQLPNTAQVISLAETPENVSIRRARMAMLTGSDAKQNLILVASKADPQSPIATRWLREIQQVIDEQQAQHPGDVTYLLGGVAATTTSADEVIFAALPKVILITLCTTFILLVYYMRALLVPLKAITLNFLCVMAAYGFQVLWFEDGWGQGLGNFIQTGGVNTIVMVVLFCTLFGLSMDYEVFILCAIRESWLDQHDMRIAVEDGLQKTAGIITSAAVIMVSVFLCFAFGSVVETQQLGIGLSFAVLLDATIIRLILAPSAMAIMGKWSWWLPGQPLPITSKAKGDLSTRAAAAKAPSQTPTKAP